MSSNELLLYARRQPFVPFRIVLTTGESYDVVHPDLIMVGKRSAMVGFADPGQPPVFDRLTIVDLLHIVRMEELPSTAPTSSNGQKG